MSGDQDEAVLAELSRRIALFEQGESVGDCMGSSTDIYRQLTFWLVAGIIAWCVLALVAR